MPGGADLRVFSYRLILSSSTLRIEGGSWLSNKTGYVQFPFHHFSSLASFVLVCFYDVERMSLPLRRSVGLDETARAEALGKC